MTDLLHPTGPVALTLDEIIKRKAALPQEPAPANPVPNPELDKDFEYNLIPLRLTPFQGRKTYDGWKALEEEFRHEGFHLGSAKEIYDTARKLLFNETIAGDAHVRDARLAQLRALIDIGLVTDSRIIRGEYGYLINHNDNFSDGLSKPPMYNQRLLSLTSSFQFQFCQKLFCTSDSVQEMYRTLAHMSDRETVTVNTAQVSDLVPQSVFPGSNETVIMLKRTDNEFQLLGVMPSVMGTACAMRRYLP